MAKKGDRKLERAEMVEKMEGLAEKMEGKEMAKKMLCDEMVRVEEASEHICMIKERLCNVFTETYRDLALIEKKLQSVL